MTLAPSGPRGKNGKMRENSILELNQKEHFYPCLQKHIQSFFNTKGNPLLPTPASLF